MSRGQQQEGQAGQSGVVEGALLAVPGDLPAEQVIAGAHAARAGEGHQAMGGQQFRTTTSQDDRPWR
ncbi:hypothetical protein [Nonomuraea longispora]|uniref:hypothetical protein n=1 Tax=Nonomuraea longispora TaxID=1848320 RepID=UPI001404944D|nr:hypothetical protein [Nonomuraea longispora]